MTEYIFYTKCKALRITHIDYTISADLYIKNKGQLFFFIFFILAKYNTISE